MKSDSSFSLFQIVEAKLSIQHLNRENIQLKSDLKVAPGFQ